ncbi:glycosyltransferase [Halomontanus rarus]|uniref:glycosyltransferase n=1 Tax=Halomontanus rarus TaxID=3034020 RepID=UPI001A987229
MLPFSDKNPYQEQLSQALQKQGVTITTTSDNPLQITTNLLQNGMFDIIHLHWLYPIINGGGKKISILRALMLYSVLKICSVIGIQIVWTVHNLSGHDSDMKDFEMDFYSCLAKEIADRLIVHSCNSKEIVAREYSIQTKEKILVIPHGNYINYYKNTIAKKDARLQLGVQEDTFVYLFLGQIRSYKNVPQLINVFKSIEKDHARLLIIGKPESEEYGLYIKGLCENDDRIIPRLEFIPDDEIQIFMNAADVLVLPYDEILTSGSAILGMSFSTPIVAPTQGCLSEILSDENNFLYDSDEEDFRRAMTGAVDKCSSISDFGDANFNKVTQWSWEYVGKKTMEAYSSA